MSDAAHHSKAAAEPVGAYAHARRVGNVLYLAGIGPRQRGTKVIPGVVLDAAGNVATYDIEAQVRSCFANVKIVLEESGFAWNEIVDVTVLLTDIKRDFATVNRLWGEYFADPTTSPTRTSMEVSRLPQAGNAPINFEVKVIAAKG